MIVVTGASGKLGHAIVERLLQRVDPTEIGVSVRDAAKVRDLEERGVRVRQADFSNSDSMREAFKDASQLLMISSNAGAFGGDPIAQHRAAIAAAKEVGVGRIVYTSHQGANAESAFGPARDHAITEALLKDSKVPYTALRNGYYTATVNMLLGNALESGELRAPADGKVSWTGHDDLAEAAAIILSDEGRFEGPVTLTASETLDLGDVAAITSDIHGRAIKRVTISDEEYTASLISRGTPPGRAKLFLTIFTASRAGEFAVVDPTLEKLLGRRPQTVREILASKESHINVKIDRR